MERVAPVTNRGKVSYHKAARSFQREMTVEAELPLNSTEVWALLRPMEQQVLEAKRALQNRGKVLFRQYLEAFFEENKDLHALCLIGFTPSFNDGEPCQHICYAELGQDLEQQFREAHWAHHYNANDNLRPQRQQQLGGELVDRWETALEVIYGTDWRILVARSEGGVVIKKTGFSAGY